MENSSRDKISRQNISELRPEHDITTTQIHFELTTEKADFKKNESEDEESEGEQSEDEESEQVNFQTTNYVELPKLTTGNSDKENKKEIYFVVTIVTVGLLLFFLGTIICLIIFCKKKSHKKGDNFPMQTLGDSE